MNQLAARILSRYSHVNWALADQTMVSGVNFLTGILLARYLGVEEFGRFTLAWDGSAVRQQYSTCRARPPEPCYGGVNWAYS